MIYFYVADVYVRQDIGSLKKKQRTTIIAKPLDLSGYIELEKPEHMKLPIQRFHEVFKVNREYTGLERTEKLQELNHGI